MMQVRDLTPFADSLGFAVEEYAAGKGKIPPRFVTIEFIAVAYTR